MKENVIETYLRKKCNANGFLCYKFTSPAHPGVPDRVIIGHGLTLFVETKAPGKKPRALQVEVITEMQDHGAVVYVIDTKEKVDKLIDCMLSAVGIKDAKEIKDAKDRSHVMECKGNIKVMQIVKKNVSEF